MTRCVICGRFMDDDQVFFGYSQDLDAGGQVYAHAECVHRQEEAKAEESPTK